MSFITLSLRIIVHVSWLITSHKVNSSFMEEVNQKHLHPGMWFVRNIICSLISGKFQDWGGSSVGNSPCLAHRRSFVQSQNHINQAWWQMSLISALAGEGRNIRGSKASSATRQIQVSPSYRKSCLRKKMLKQMFCLMFNVLYKLQQVLKSQTYKYHACTCTYMYMCIHTLTSRNHIEI